MFAAFGLLACGHELWYRGYQKGFKAETAFQRQMRLVRRYEQYRIRYRKPELAVVQVARALVYAVKAGWPVYAPILGPWVKVCLRVGGLVPIPRKGGAPV